MFFWAFLWTLAFSISVFLLPSARFWVFLAFRRPLFDFFPLTHACGISFGEKSQKAAFFRPKRPKKRASGNRKKEMLQASVQKNAPKNTTHPQNHISVHFYFLSNKRQRYIPFLWCAGKQCLSDFFNWIWCQNSSFALGFCWFIES